MALFGSLFGWHPGFPQDPFDWVFFWTLFEGTQTSYPVKQTSRPCLMPLPFVAQQPSMASWHTATSEARSCQGLGSSRRSLCPCPCAHCCQAKQGSCARSDASCGTPRCSAPTCRCHHLTPTPTTTKKVGDSFTLHHRIPTAAAKAARATP